MTEPEPTGETNSTDLIAFRIADQDFCFNIMSVREIRGWTPATVIPHAPEYVCGVINLRGTVVPILNLALRLGLDVTDPTPRSVVIISRIHDQTVGLLVDAVSDILSVSEDEIQKAPDFTSGETSGFVEGIITRGEDMIRMIDVSRMLPDRAAPI